MGMNNEEAVSYAASVHFENAGDNVVFFDIIRRDGKKCSFWMSRADIALVGARLMELSVHMKVREAILEKVMEKDVEPMGDFEECISDALGLED